MSCHKFRLIRSRPQRLSGAGLVCAITAATMTLAGLVACAQSDSSNAAGAPQLDGFTSGNSSKELANEDFVIKTVGASKVDEYLKYLSEYPGEAATPGIERRKDYIVKLAKADGWDVSLQTFYEYLSDSQKVKVQLDMTAPFHQSLATKEKQYPWYKDFDKTSVGFNEGTPAADLTKQVVYANYGRNVDFTYLASQGIDVHDKIVLVRYSSGAAGGVQRSEPPYQAFIHGAAGLIFYSDPSNTVKGPMYPNGPWAAPDVIQRGTVYRWTLYNGDPLTPGYEATKDAPRIPVGESDVGKIVPTTPIGYGAAEPLLKNLGGPVAPKSWQGALPFTYHLGPGPTAVHLKIDIQYKNRPVTNIVARITGSEFPDQMVVLVPHYGAWNYGAGDNGAAAAGALETARVLGQLHKKGWKPKRTIVILWTTAEERGIAGSAEWTEMLGKDKMANVVVEFNGEGGGGKHFSGSSVPSLNKLLFDVTKRVPWPGTKGSAYDNWAGSSGQVPSVKVPGGGSDFMSFLDHFGVPSMSVAVSTPGDNYHCICDDYYAVNKFRDPGLIHTAAFERVRGSLLLRLADADILPLNYSATAKEVVGYLQAFAGAERLKFGYIPIPVDRDIAAAKQWQAAAEALESERQRLLNSSDTSGYAAVNAALMQVSRAMLVPGDEGLPGRPWFRNQLYAPQFHNGFALQLLPGLYDSLIEFGDVDQGKQYEQHLYQSLQHAVKITQSWKH